NDFRILRLGHRAKEDDRVAIEERACAEGHVEGEGDDFLAPDDLSVKLEGRQDGGAEGAIDEFSIGGGRWSGISSASATAEIAAHPWAGRNLRVPKHFPISRVIAGQMVLRNQLRAVLHLWRPVRSAHKNKIAPDDRAGVPLPLQARAPQHIFVLRSAPGDRQVLLLGVPKAGRASKA